jgi:hypothetical protein
LILRDGIKICPGQWTSSRRGKANHETAVWAQQLKKWHTCIWMDTIASNFEWSQAKSSTWQTSWMVKVWGVDQVQSEWFVWTSWEYVDNGQCEVWKVLLWTKRKQKQFRCRRQRQRSAISPFAQHQRRHQDKTQ